MDNVKPEFLIITMLISYTIGAFAATTVDAPMWIVGLCFAGFVILFFPIILQESNSLMERRYKNRRGVYYLLLYLFFVFYMIYFVIRGIFSGLRSYGKKK